MLHFFVSEDAIPPDIRSLPGWQSRPRRAFDTDRVGWCELNGRDVWIQAGLSGTDTQRAIAHECAHAHQMQTSAFDKMTLAEAERLATWAEPATGFMPLLPPMPIWRA